MIDFYASQPHYLDHLAPVWRALAETERGSFTVAPGLEGLAEWHGVIPSDEVRGTVLAVAGWRDARGGTSGRKIALFEHGVGQTYDGRRAEYVGGANRDVVSLFLSPNARAFEINSAATPSAEHAMVGVPKMDALFGRAKHPSASAVGVSFHWDCQVTNETMSGFKYFRDGVLALRRQWVVVGHCHPAAALEVEPWYRTHDVYYASHFDSVIKSCAAYACDNSSTIYEFAALDRPVVVLNPPHYRRDVEHGLRFWEYADVGVQCNDPDLLPAAVEVALEDPIHVKERRHEVTEALFPFRDGSSSRRAADALLSIE